MSREIVVYGLQARHHRQSSIREPAVDEIVIVGLSFGAIRERPQKGGNGKCGRDQRRKSESGKTLEHRPFPEFGILSLLIVHFRPAFRESHLSPGDSTSVPAALRQSRSAL